MALLEYTDAEGKVQRIDLPASASGLILGRSPSCHIVVPSPSIGRNHGRLDVRDGSWTYTDLGSVNGSQVNGEKLTGTVALADGDAVRCGDVTLRFHGGAGRPAPRPAPEAPRPAAAPVRKDTGRSPTDGVALVEVARLRKENAALRAEIQAMSGKAGAGGEAEVLRKHLDEARTAQAAAEDEARHLRGLLADNERRVKDAESRATVASSSLESVHSKYMDMRDQVQHLQGLVDQVRGEASDREVEAAEMRERLSAAQAQVESIRGRSSQAAEDVANLKVKLTERDREVERLRREMDTREYDLKALREENERLAEYCQVDSGKQNQLERKVRNLEAVIDDNRNLIAELRRSVEEKDREVREVRLGAGIADLEQEKQRLLDDYHKKSRDLDAARSTIASHAAELAGAAEREALEGRVRQLEEAARTRRSEREDISDHPEYKARVRELAAREETLAQVQADLDRALKQQAECPPEERTRLAAELAATQEKTRALAARVEELQARLAARAEEPAPVVLPPAPAVGARAFPDGASEALDSLLDGLTVLSSGLRDTIGFLTALARSEVPLPPDVAAALDGATLLETAESLRDTLRLITSEADALRSRRDE